MRDDQLRAGIVVDETPQPVCDRRQAAASVDQDRHPPLGGKLEDRTEPVVRGIELLRTWMELDPARAEVEAACRLLDRLLLQVEPDERDDATLRAGCERERPVVRGPKGRVPVGLVEAEHEAA